MLVLVFTYSCKYCSAGYGWTTLLHTTFICKCGGFFTGRQGTEQTARVLQAICDHGSDISDLSDDDERDDDFNIDDASVQSNPDESSDSVASEADSDDEPLSSLTHQAATRWKQTRSFNPDVADIPQIDDDRDRSTWAPIDYMNEYLDKEFFALMSSCTNINSVARSGKSLNTTAAEIERFLGATVFMSCISYPRIRMYWQRGLQIPLVCGTITRDRYFKIRSSLKVVVDTDVSDDAKKQDGLWKVRPLLDRIRTGCLKQARPSMISIDEQMIPFTGMCRMKQYVPNKPNPVGLKNFVAARPDGLVVDFVVYHGANSFQPVPPELKLGVGGTVVSHLSESFISVTRIYCDRYFTSLPLIDHMLKKSIYITGTVMKNRLPKPVYSMSDDKVLMARGRGSCDQLVRGDNKVSVLKWFDNKPIIMASSVHGEEPRDECRRWSKTEKEHKQISRPAVIREYNEKMGGVDLCDRMIAFYRMSARTRKWTVRTLMHFIDLALASAWFQYRQDAASNGTPKKDIMQFLDFRVSIAQVYLAAVNEEAGDSDESETDSAAAGRRRQLVTAVPATQQRAVGMHLPLMTDLQYSMRCRSHGCTQKTKVKCTKCNVYLCMVAGRNCFYEFHNSD